MRVAVTLTTLITTLLCSCDVYFVERLQAQPNLMPSTQVVQSEEHDNTTLSPRISWSTTGPAFAVPAIDERAIYVGSGFGTNSCFTDSGEIRAFDKNTLALIWKAKLKGAIGDTTIWLMHGKVLFGVGRGLAALAVTDGKLLWQLDLEGCFQESFIRLHREVLYVGSSSGHIYAITSSGEIRWQNRLPGTVFAAPAVRGDTLYFVDMTNTLSAVRLETGAILWKRRVPVGRGKRVGIFASPLIDDAHIILAAYSGDVWRVSLQGRMVRRYTTGERYVASPIYCDHTLITANLSGQIDWLETDTLQPRHTLTLPERYLFGTPQCVDGAVLVTTYGDAGKPSRLYYLKAGQILNAVTFPCCQHALTTTRIDGYHVYNLLTTYSGQRQASLIRSKLNIK